MRSFPFLNYFCKRRKNFFRMERIPADFRTDSLFLQLGRTPDQRGPKSPEQRRHPNVRNEQRTHHQQNPGSHDIWPPQISEVAFPADDPDESKRNDEKSKKTECESEEVHDFVSSHKCSIISLIASL